MHRDEKTLSITDIGAGRFTHTGFVDFVFFLGVYHACETGFLGGRMHEHWFVFLLGLNNERWRVFLYTHMRRLDHTIGA